MSFKLAGLALALVLGVSATVGSVYAADPPDSTQVIEARAYTNLLATGDLLVPIYYDLEYATIPSDNVDNTFVIWLQDASTRIATSTPYPYFDSDGDGSSDGYGEGVASVYMTPAQTFAAGLTDSAGAWVAWPDTSLAVYLEGNPSAFTVALPYDAEAFDASNSSSNEVRATNQSELGVKVLQWAADLQANHSVTLLLSGQNLLNDTNGSGYFTLAIPGLRQMAPAIFAVSTSSPTIPTAATRTGDFGEAAEERFESSTYYGQGFVDLATATGLPNGSIEGGLVLLLSVAMIGWSAKTWGTPGARMALVFSAVFLLPIMWIGTGWVAWSAGALALAAIALAATIKTAREF